MRTPSLLAVKLRQIERAKGNVSGEARVAAPELGGG